MNPSKRFDEIIDEALKRLGTPSRENLDAARERIRENVRSANPADATALPVLDTRPVSLWGLRQPFLIAGGFVVAFAALTATAFWILSGRSPAPSVSKVVVEPTQSGPTQINEAPAMAPPEIAKPTSRAKAIKKTEPKRVVEKAEPPEEPLIGVRPIVPEAVPPPEPVDVQSDGDSARAVLDRVCGFCHGLRGIEKYSFSSRDAYKDLLSEMVARGAVISDEESAIIVEYLYKTYGQK
jgi:hypothetical protein